MLGDLRFRLPVVFAGLVILHTSVFPQFRVFGVMPDVLLLLAIAGGVAGGPTQGASLGFGAGLVADLFLTTPLGLSALVLSVVGYAIGLSGEGLLHSAWWFLPVTALAGSAGGVGLFALTSAMLGVGQPLDTRLLAIMAVVGLGNALMAPWVVRLVRWALDASKDGRRGRAYAA